MKRIFIFFALLLPSWVMADWQPVVHNFSPKQYGAGTQNWHIEQAPSGWMYVANNYGLLQYDGVEWNLQGVNNSSVVHALHVGDDGVIYAGGRDEFGYFVTNEYGEMTYTSLSENVPESCCPYGEVWGVHEYEERLCYQTRRYVFLTDRSGSQPEVINPGAIIYCSLIHDRNLYLATDRGVFLYSGNRLHLLSGSSLLSGKIVSCMAALDEERILIGTDFDGVYVCDKGGLRPARTAANEYLCRNQLYSMAVWNGRVAYGTVLQGVILTDEMGEIVRVYNHETGLQNNTVLSLFFDRDGNLWVGEDIGIDHIPLQASSEYLLDSWICGVGYTYAEYKGESYFGTNQGLYRRNGDGFDMIEGSQGQVWHLCPVDDMLFCCHNRGLMLVQGDHVKLLDVPDGVWNVLPRAPGIVLACSYSGLYQLRFENDSCQVLNSPHAYQETMFYSAIDRGGHVWTTSSRGIIHLVPDTAFSSVAEVRLLLQDKVLSQCAVVQADSDVLVCSPEQIWQVENDGDLVPSRLWRNRLGGCDKYTAIYQTKYGWAAVSSRGVFLNGKEVYSRPDFFNAGFENLSLSADGRYLVIGGVGGFHRVLLERAMLDSTGQPWQVHKVRRFIPWYRTWWMWTIYWVLGLSLLLLICWQAHQLMLAHDARLTSEREAEIQRQQMRIMQLEHDKTHYELEEKSRQLNNALLGRVNRNEIISGVQEDLRRVADCLQKTDLEMAKKLVRQLQGKLSASNRRQEGDWQHFEENFNEVNETFVIQLRKLYPWMSHEEQKLCMYIYMGLQTKEIGPLLHLSTRGVEMMRYRMRKQMNLPAQTNLKAYFDSLQ